MDSPPLHIQLKPLFSLTNASPSFRQLRTELCVSSEAAQRQHTGSALCPHPQKGSSRSPRQSFAAPSCRPQSRALRTGNPGGTVPSLLRPGCSHSAEGPPTTGRETRTVPRRTRERLRALQSPPGSGAAAPPSRAGGSRERRRPPRTPPPSELAVNPIFLKTTYIYISYKKHVQGVPAAPKPPASPRAPRS